MVESRAVPTGNIVHLVKSFGTVGQGSQDICLYHVFNVAEITAGFAITIYDGGFPIHKGIDPARNNSCVCAIGVLPLPEYVEIPQPNPAKIVYSRKNSGVNLIYQF